MNHNSVKYRIIRKPNKLGLGFKFFDYETRVCMYCKELIYYGLEYAACLGVYKLITL